MDRTGDRTGPRPYRPPRKGPRGPAQGPSSCAEYFVRRVGHRLARPAVVTTLALNTPPQARAWAPAGVFWLAASISSLKHQCCATVRRCPGLCLLPGAVYLPMPPHASSRLGPPPTHAQSRAVVSPSAPQFPLGGGAAPPQRWCWAQGASRRGTSPAPPSWPPPDASSLSGLLLPFLPPWATAAASGPSSRAAGSRRGGRQPDARAGTCFRPSRSRWC